MKHLSIIGSKAMLLAWCMFFTLLSSNAHAQVEVISKSQETHYLAQFPEVVQSASPASFKQYLTQLQTQLKNVKPAGDSAEQREQYNQARKQLVRQIITASRVAMAMKSDAKVAAGKSDTHNDTYFAPYVVPAQSSVIRLADEYPSDGRYNGEIVIIAAKDEYEPASFSLYPLADAENVTLEISDLKTAEGSLFPKNKLDLKVVKIWYQNGNGWFSYFADPGLTLVPELLVHDEKLITVDTDKKANYARVFDNSSSKQSNQKQNSKQVWISAPRELDLNFDHYDPGFIDADSLAPVTLQTGQFKQFMLTAHVTKDIAAGLYKGSIQVSAQGRAAVSLPVSLRVLPFVLPLPMTYHELDKPLLVSLMNAWPVLPVNHPAMLPSLQNLRQHNMLHTAPGLNQRNPGNVEALVPLMKEAGFETKPIIHRHAFSGYGSQGRAAMSWNELMHYDIQVKRWAAFYEKNFGHTDVYLGFGDEPGAQWIMNVRPFWRLTNKNGLKTQLAGHEQLFAKGGYLLDLHQQAAYPSESEKARHHNDVGFAHVAFYAGQHNGVENPDYVRRQHGLLSYLSGFTAVHNYMFAYGPWNDLSSTLYKPMVLAYPISNGLVDTLAWEGFREGIDDVRYATYLLQQADAAAASDDLDRIYAGRKVRMWLSLMDGRSADLAQVRLEMINKILELTRLQTPVK